jgi:fumarylacetoacetate (FAA) hydrolase
MKLLTYDTGNGPRCGVLRDDNVVDVAALLGADQILPDVRALLELGHSPVERVRNALASNGAAPSVPLANVRLRSPVLQPPTVRDYMIYEEHATAQGTRQREEAWYRMPIFYFSNPLCIFGPNDPIPFPSASEMLDYELEIGCVIGREGRNVPESDAMDYIAGFLIFNDWSCRDIQRDESAVGLGPAKGKDSASTLGPWLVTTDELAPYMRNGRLQVKCHARVNGDFWLKDGDGGVPYHTWGAVIERASKDSRIVPGDVLGSGTVGGGSIGEAIRKGVETARFLQPGDVVEHEVEGIGVLRNTIGPKENYDPNYRYKPKEQPSLPERGIAKDYKYELKLP